MDTKQIVSILNSCTTTKRVFRGVYPLDHIKQGHGPGVYICNTDPSDMPGEHWIVIALSEDGTGEYFDSFGLPPLKPEFLKFLNKESHQWTYNSECPLCVTPPHHTARHHNLLLTTHLLKC